MSATNIDSCGDMYLPIYRDGIPMLVQFQYLKPGDVAIRCECREEVAVGVGGCKHGDKTYFFHDPQYNAWFPSDFQKQPVLLFGGNLSVDADIHEINSVLFLADADTALAELAAFGYREADLRERGFGFLFDIMQLH